MLALLLSLVFLFASSASATCTDSVSLNLTADAYQYATSINPFENDYKEWWFFTVFDTQADVAWCMGYSVTAPSSKKDQISGIAGMFWPNFQTNSSNLDIIADVYSYSDFSASSENATVFVGASNKVKALNLTAYSVEGATKDGSLQWSFTYHQVVPACREIFEVAMLELNWISYMPTAMVEGYIVHNGNKIPISGKGYHDHNWGVWPTAEFNWVWAQYGDESQDFALVMGAYNIPETKDYIGYVFVRVNGEKTKIGTLCGDSYALTPLKFEEYQGHKYSVSNHVEVKGKDWWLSFEYNTITSGVNPGGVGLNLLVFEQVSQYNVTLSQPDGKGGWNVVVQSVGLGFNEWSDVIAL